MWYVYIIECNNRSLYTGVTIDVARRAEEHFCGKGAKYTKAHKAIQVVFKEEHKTRSSACKREAEIKILPRKDKLALIEVFRKM